MSVPSQEIIDAIIEKTGLGVSEALLAGKVLMDAAESYIDHGGDKIPTSIKIFRGGLWETVNIPLNIAQGDVTSLAITKAIVGAATGVGIAALAAYATAGAPFIIGFGAAFAFGIYAGQKISEAVESGYDTIIGPDYRASNAINVKIAAGSTYGTFDVEILGDETVEPTETFYSLVQSVTDSAGAAVDFTLVDVQPFTIEENDVIQYANIVISNPTLVEETATMRFEIKLLGEALSKDITIGVQTFDGSATSGEDYIGSRGSVTIKEDITIDLTDNHPSYTKAA